MSNEHTPQPPAGWVGTVGQFLTTPVTEWLGTLRAAHERRMLQPEGTSQIAAWRNCYAVLGDQLADCTRRLPRAGEWTLAFEYELPRERGRRPDVVVLAGVRVVVLEFKDASRPLQAHVDQASAYARDLRHYHASSHHRPVRPVLVLTLAKDLFDTLDDVTVVGSASLADVLLDEPGGPMVGAPIDPEGWLTADYAPLPSLVSAARTIFEHEPLPSIRRARSAGIPETIEALVAVGDKARREQELHLALVTGVPGAGKTLVGLQFVYASRFAASEGGRPAVFLSGNGPLVKVLQHALRSSVFVQDVHGFLRQYGGESRRLPEEHVWVYDEAQRAWDAERVREKRGHGASEPEDFLRLGQRMGSWAVVVGLVGEGQEIHLGEEAGLGQWNDAIAALPGPWIVHCPERIARQFPAASQVQSDDRLDLTVSLRSHLAEDVQRWIGEVLGGDLDGAAVTNRRMTAQGFDAYLTRDLSVAEHYARERYAGQEDKRYGLLASSKAKNLVPFGIRNDYSFTKNLREGPWYNDPPDSRFSCCQLRDVATEFACQGLELDFPIVCWGDDLPWERGVWRSRPQPRSAARDPHQLRVNSYRVLLSRGRDGFAVFVPPGRGGDATAQALVTAGLRPLDDA